MVYALCHTFCAIGSALGLTDYTSKYIHSYIRTGLVLHTVHDSCFRYTLEYLIGHP